MITRKKIGVPLLLCLLTTSALASGVKIDVKIVAEKIGFEDTLIYIVTIEGIANAAEPDLSGIKDFGVGVPQRSTGFGFVGGASYISVSYLYELTPLKTGTLTIPPVTYRYKGKTYRSRSFSVEVVKGTVKPAEGELDVKLQIETTQSEVKQGQPVSFRVLLYTRSDLTSLKLVSLEAHPEDMTVFDISPGGPIRLKRRKIGDKVYAAFEMGKGTFSSVRVGEVALPTVTYEMAPKGSARNKLFLNRKPRPETPKTRFSTQEVTVRISPLSPGSSEDLPIGVFSFEVTPDKWTVDINDTLILSLVVRVKEGTAAGIEIPQFKNGEYYNVLLQKGTTDRIGTGRDSTPVREKKMIVSFNSPGLISFPSLEFKYYNRHSDAVVILESKPFSISVTGSKK